MSRKQLKRTAGNMVFRTIAGIFIFAVICGVGFGVASADSSDDVARNGAFGFDAATQTATSSSRLQVASLDGTSAAGGDAVTQSPLAEPSPRSIDSSLQMIEAKERAERERKAAEEKAERERRAAEEKAERERRAAEEKAERERIEAENAAALDRVAYEMGLQGTFPDYETPASERVEYGLPAVDWTVGREAFVAEWTARIDAFLDGSALAGYGYAFAEAAWDNGVDPRWSPAISSTESGKGSVCFLPCNAWGWGDRAWGDWDTAIREHVAGLASGYGYCITYGAASTYCPPNTDFWYSNTFEQMSSI